jgi:hypothetical protein
MRSRVPQKLDGIYHSSVELITATWKNHPFRIPILMVVFLLSLTVSAGILVPPQSPVNQKVQTAKANTYQFVPTAGNLVTGTAQNANSLLAAAAEGVNTGSWKGTLTDDNFHWQVTAADSGTPNLNMQLDLGTAKLANANKLVIQTEVDLDSASRTLLVQICDWVSSTSVDAAADSECTTGGWRSLNSQNASNADVAIALTTGAAFQWHIFDGYFSSGTGGGTTISTPLTNFTSSDTQPIRVRYWSDSDVVGSGDVAVDFLRANAFVDSIYHPAGVVNQNGSGGALTGTYANAHTIGNSATAQQSVTAGNAVRLEGAGTAGSVADYYLVFKNVKTYTGANTFYFKADYSCSAATAGLDHKFSIYNFATTTWVDFNSAVIACSTTDATHAWAENNITPADFIDESASDEVRVRFLGDLNSTTTLRIDFAYLMLGSTNSDSAQCEVTWGTGTATNCTNTRDLIGPAAATVFSNPAEDKSNTVDNDYYALDCPATATAGECSAANMNVPVTVPADAQVVVNHFAGKFAGDLVGTTNPDLTAQMGLRDYSGTPTSTSGPGGWTLVGASSATSTQIYTDSITALAIGTYGMQINPDDHVDTASNVMNIRMRSTAEGIASDNSRWEWDFGMASIGWVVDSSHPTRNYQFAPTGDTLVAGTEVARLGLTAPSATVSVNTGGWQATLGDDNLEWTINGANVVGTNYDLQLNFATAKQNGANKLMIQTEFDTDANIAMNVQICDWVSSTSVDAAADARCTTGGWRSLVSQNASNADVTYTGTTLVPLQWHIFDGYFTTGTTGGSPISTPLRNFFDATNGVKIRFFSTTQSATAIDVDFVRLQPIIDSTYHPSSVTNLNGSGGALAGTYANAHVVGNSASAQQSTTTADAVYLTGAGTAGSVADYYLSFSNIKTYTGANSIYFKADYSCSAATAGLDHQFAIYNFTSAAWENLNSAAIACSTTDATHGWAKNNITLADYVNGGETRIRYYGDLNSTTTLRLDFAYIMVGSTNADTADCAVTFGSGTATNCSNTRDLVGPGTATRFDNAAEDESTTMGTGDANSYHAFDNETTPDTTTEESTSANISFPVTQPTNSSIVGQNYAARFSGCGNTGAACGAATLTVQLGFKDYAGFNAAVGGWLQVGGTSASSTLAYTDTLTAMTIGVYGQQISPEDYLDTANNKVNMRLRTTTPGTSTTNVTTVWDFAMASIQWIEIGSTIDIAGSSSVTGLTVAVAVDGLLQVGKTATTAGGSCPCAWSITSVFVAGDRPVLVWHDAASDANESSGITVYDGSGNIASMQLTAHTFSIGSGDDQSVDSTDLVKFDNGADEDVMYKFETTTFTADATATYSDDTVDILSGDTLTIGGSETMLTYNTTINGTLTSGGATTYTIQGDWINNGTFNESTSTVTMNGTTSEDLNSGCSNFDTCTAQNFYNLTLNKTDAGASNDNLTLVTSHVRVTNTFTITDGELIQGTLNIRVEGASAVSVTSNGTWTNISTGDLKLGGTFVNNGAVTLNSNNGTQCVDAADDIVITSTSGGSQRAWSGSGTETIYNVSVTDMTDSSVTAYTSAFSNTTWTAGSCGIAITGSCDQFDQTTDCTDDGGNQFRVAINGSLQAQVDTTVDGTINITGVSAPSTGDIVTVFIDGETTDDEEAVAVTKYDGTGDITGVVLYWRHLSIGSADGQTLSNSDIDAYDNGVSGDEDIFFEVTAGDDLTVDTLTSYSDEELYIVTGNTYRPASAGGGDVNTTHLENDGTITADSNAINVFGSWQNDGTFTNGTSTTTFTSTTTGRTLAGTLTGATGRFYNLVFNGVAGTWSFSAAVEATNDFQVSNGGVTASNNNLTVGRDFILDNTAGVSYTPGSSTIAITRHFTDVAGTRFAEDTSTVQLTGTGTITYGNGGDFNNLSIGYSGFTTTFSANNWDMFGTLTFNGGSVAGGGSYISLRRSVTGSSVTFASATTLSGTQTLYHVGVGASITYTIAGGDYGTWGVSAYAAANSETYSLGGNFSSTGFLRFEAETGVTGSAFNTGTSYAISTGFFLIAPCSPSRTGSWAIDLNDSTVTLSSTTNALYVGTDCGSHTLDLDTSDVTVNGSVSFVSGTTSVSVTPGTSDFTFAPAAGQTETYASNAQSLWNMTINGANGAATIQPTSAVDVNNNFTITAGTYDTVSGSNWGLTIGNNYSNSGTFTARSGTVTFDATDTGNTLGGTMTGGSAFYDMVFNGVSGGWTYNAAVAATNDFTVTNGAVTANGNNLTVTRDFTLANTSGVSYVSGSTTITVSRHWNDTGIKHVYGTSTVILNGTGTVTAASSNDCFYNLSVAYSGFTTTMADYLRLANQGVITFNGGSLTGSGGRIYLNSNTSNTPIVFASPTTITNVDWNINLNANGITVTLPAGNYGSAFSGGIGVAYRNNTTPTSATVQFGGNITTTGDIRFGTQNATNSMTVNTQGFSLTAKGIFFGSCLGFGCTNPVNANFGASTMDLDTSGLVVLNNGGAHTLDLGSSTINVNGDVKFVDGTGTITVTPGSSTLIWDHTSGTKSYAPNGQSLWNLSVNGSGGTVQPTAAVEVNNDFSISGGIYDTVSGSNHALSIGGNYSNSGTFTAQQGTVTFDATDTGNTLSGTMTGSSPFYNLTFNGSGGDWTPGAAVTVSNDLTVTTGSLLGTQNISVTGHVAGGSGGIINLTGGTFTHRLTLSGNKNFGTTTGSSAWTFSGLTFANDSAICTGRTSTTQTGGSGGITVTGILNIGESGDTGGCTTTLDAGNRTWTLSGTGGDPFQVLASPAGDLAPSTSTFTYTGNNGAGDTTVQSETYNNLSVNNGSETYNLEGTTFGADVTVTAGTLALNGQTLNATNDLTVNGTLSGSTNVTSNGSVTGSGTINLSGGTFTQRITSNADETFGSTSGSNNWTFNNLTFRNSDTNNHTITVNSTGSGQVIVSASATFGSGTDTNNVTLDFDTNDRVLDVNGSVDITTRGVLEPSSSASFTVGDNWTNSGAFNHNSGTVTFDTTTTATFTGATTFYNFTSTTAAKTLEFTSGQTFTIDTGGLFTLTGAADPNEIQIKSTTPTSQWLINHQGTEAVDYVQVIDSGCDGASTQITTTNSVNDGNNGTCWLFGSTFEQADYRFGEEPEDSSTGSEYAGMPAENTAYSTSGTGDVFRLRMLLHVGGSNLAINGETFKLQYGEKTAATCTSGVSWGDVGTGSGVIRYSDGPPNDGDNITTVTGDPDHSGHTRQYQDYEESNNFTNSVSGINSGQDGVWAFSLVNHSAVAGKRYCFKAVKSTGTDLDTYTFYPELIIDEELIFSLDSTSKTFGVVTPGANPTDVSSTLTTSTNSSTGYVVYAWATQVMTKGSDTLSDWSGTNSAPTTFGNGSFGFGYTTDDSSLTGGTANRFTNGGAKYAGFTHVGPGDPVADRTSGPVTGSTDTIGYRLAASTVQAAGTYGTVIVYVCSVTF